MRMRRREEGGVWKSFFESLRVFSRIVSGRYGGNSTARMRFSDLPGLARYRLYLNTCPPSEL